MRKITIAAAMAAMMGACAMGPTAVAAPQGAPAPASGAKAIVERAQTLVELGDQASSAVISLDHRAIMRPDDAQGLAALLASLDRADAVVADAVAKLRALPPWTGDPEDVALVDKVTRDQVIAVEGMADLARDIRRVATAAKNGDKPGMEAAARRLVLNGERLLESQAAGMRARALLVEADSSDMSSLRAQAAVVDGSVALLRCMMKLDQPKLTSEKLRKAEASIRDLVARGRAALAAQSGKRSGRSPTAIARLERSDQIEGQIFDSLERSAAVLGDAAVRLAAAPPGPVDVRPEMGRLRVEETRQRELQGEMAELFVAGGA